MHLPNLRVRKLSPATVVGCIALFVALSGTAIAASRYLITSTNQIKPSVVRALTAPGPDLDVTGSRTIVKAGQIGPAALANCPTGYHVLSGGYFDELTAGAFVQIDHPRGTLGWTVVIDNRHGTETSEVIAEALCAPGVVTSEGWKG